MDLEPKDRTCLETVDSDGLISEDLDRRTSVACTPACNYPTRNNESLDLLVPSRARLHTSFDSRFASIYRSLYAVTIRPKSLYEDVHASTGHPGYTGMQWHQKKTIGANYTDKDAAAPRGICQGCALGSAHQYPTNQHYVMSDTPHDPGQQFVVDAFTHHSVGHSGSIYAHLFTDLASRQVYPVFTKSPSLHPTCRSSSTHTQIENPMAQSLIARPKWIWKPDISQQISENSAILLDIG